MNFTRTAFALAIAVTLVGCSGSGASSSFGGGASPSTGSVAISLKDAPSDHISRFEVDVASVDLVRDDGVHVAVLAGTQRLDLARLVTVSQLLSVYDVPIGTYRSLAITFDLSKANVTIDDATTNATLVDASGAALSGKITRTVDMEKPIVVEPFTSRYVELDFDLDASCVVDPAKNRVTLGPVLKADTEPARPVDTMIGGVLTDVASGDARDFTIEMRPPTADPGSGPRVKIAADANTVFLIDGKTATFDALRALPPDSEVAAQGRLSPTRDKLVAARVFSGKQEDMIEGLVLARTASGTLTLAGRAVTYPSGAIRSGTFTCDARDAMVLAPPIGRDGAPPIALGADAIAVGQHVDARGKITGDALAPSHVVLLPTPVFGIATSDAAGGLVRMNVQRIAMRDASDFDFAVGGVASADPRAFVVATATLDVATIASGTPFVAIGILAPWNAPASAPDMNAVAIADRRNATAVLQCEWPTPTEKPFASLGAGGLVLDLTNAARRQIDAGDATPTPLDATDRPSAAPAPDASFVIIANGVQAQFHDMASFAGEATSRLATTKARAIGIVGSWDASTKELVAHQIVLQLE